MLAWGHLHKAAFARLQCITEPAHQFRIADIVGASEWDVCRPTDNVDSMFLLDGSLEGGVYELGLIANTLACMWVRSFTLAGSRVIKKDVRKLSLISD